MKSAQTVRATFAIVSTALSGAVTAGVAHAQVPRSTPITPTPSTATASDPTGWIVASALILGLLVIIGAVVKFYDLRRKREAEAVHLQAQISDALLRDPVLFGLPIAATAHAPLWSGTPVTIELSGEVHDPTLREPVLRIAEFEARRIRPDVEIVDRMTLREAAHAA
jgi:hypothetical protein